MTELSSLAGRLFLEKMPFALVKTCENMGRRIEFNVDSIRICAIHAKASTNRRGLEFLNVFFSGLDRQKKSSPVSGDQDPLYQCLSGFMFCRFRLTDNTAGDEADIFGRLMTTVLGYDNYIDHYLFSFI